MSRFTAPLLVSASGFVFGVALQISDFKSLPLAYALWGATVVGLLWAAAVAFDTPIVMAHWRWDWPWWGSIPLSDGARIAYRRLEGTVWVHLAQQHPTEAERLEHMASYLGGEVKILGRKPPGTHAFLSEMALSMGNYSERGNTIHMPGNPAPYRVELRIQRSDLWRAIKSMKNQAGLGGGVGIG